MKSFSSFVTFFLATFGSYQSSAFVVGPSSYSRSAAASALAAAVVTDSDSRLFYRDSSEDTQAFTTDIPRIIKQKTTLPRLSKLELPRQVEADVAKARMMFQVEMVVGRVAMVAAVVLFLVEVTTGQSLPDQIASWI